MRFIVDAQLPPALARWLLNNGYEADHVGDAKIQAASGSVIWDYASARSAIIVTKDDDFTWRKVLAKGPSII